jgi:starvation-inducible DNA-binding protein
VVGKNFRDLHLQLDEVVDAAREASDTIAERMRALGVVPDWRSDTIAATTTLAQFPADEQDTAEAVDLITTRIYTAVDTIRAVHDAVDAVDPSTTDLLHAIIDTLEKLAWMVKSKNRKLCSTSRTIDPPRVAFSPRQVGPSATRLTRTSCTRRRLRSSAARVQGVVAMPVLEVLR